MTNKTFLAVCLAIGLTGCSEAVHETEPAASPAPLPVTVATAAMQQWPSTYEATGTVRARTSTIISAKWMGYVREVNVHVGDQVREGELLVALDTSDLDASSARARAARDEVRNAVPEAESGIAAAKAHLDLVQVTFRRMNELYSKQSISDQEFDEASAKMKAAQAAYDMARSKRAQLDAKLAQADQEVRAAEVTRGYAEIHAPSSGLITAKSVDSGNLAAPGAPLLTLERDGYRFEALVEESRLGAIRAGQAVSVKLDSIDRSFDGHVSEVVPAVDAASRAYTVKIDLPASPLLRSGIFGRAVFPTGSRSLLSIPAGAVVERGQLQSVYVVGNATARTRLVTLGEKRKDQVEVLSGLNAGEKIIVPIPRDLADTTRVEVRP